MEPSDKIKYYKEYYNNNYSKCCCKSWDSLSNSNKVAIMDTTEFQLHLLNIQFKIFIKKLLSWMKK